MVMHFLILYLLMVWLNKTSITPFETFQTHPKKQSAITPMIGVV